MLLESDEFMGFYNNQWSTHGWLHVWMWGLVVWGVSLGHALGGNILHSGSLCFLFFLTAVEALLYLSIMPFLLCSQWPVGWHLPTLKRIFTCLTSNFEVLVLCFRDRKMITTISISKLVEKQTQSILSFENALHY